MAQMELTHPYKVKDINLAEKGRMRIDWAESRMPVLMELRERFEKSKPLKGQRIAGSLHVTKETAVLVETLIAAGADISWSGCNPLSTNDEVAAALAANGVKIWAWHGMNTEEYYWALDKTLEFKPTLTLDDGADLIFVVHNKHADLAPDILGGTEETTTGVHRLRAMADDNKLLYPVVAVNDSPIKSHFDNVYGTGQSTLDGILRATSILYAGKTVVVAGYGRCGGGVAMKAKGLGSSVIVTEVDPVKALKAALDGFRVMKMDDAAKLGDIFITATGMRDVITLEQMETMKDGAILSNTGHYDVEIEVDKLLNSAENVRTIRPNNEEITLKNGNKIYLLARGRLVNLAAAEGHPSEVMDMSFCGQLMALISLAEKTIGGANQVYTLPYEIDLEIAHIKLKSLGFSTDTLTPEQQAYITAYDVGT
ncbi:MAG: Adenosylhomocysteinase [Candidatus Heimdallarchaeota archaeon LC_2]|nr:MAG: Adenosylhomocysteinase [Candidatus Heimdallarchaeota archaeon LC_2]